MFNKKLYIGELLLMGAPRSVIVIGSLWMATFSMMLLKASPGGPIARSEMGRMFVWIILFMGWALMPWILPDMSKAAIKMAVMLIFIISWFLCYTFFKGRVRIFLTNKIYMAMAISLAVAVLLAGRTLFSTVIEKQPFFPFQINYYSPALYDVQLWAKNNTKIDAVFLNLTESIKDDTLRNFSERGSYYNKRAIIDILGNPKYYPEWRHRHALYVAIKKALESDVNKIKIPLWLKGENIQYLIVDKNVNLDLKLSYENDKYRIFMTGN
jgi:hypothetical protein